MKCYLSFNLLLCTTRLCSQIEGHAEAPLKSLFHVSPQMFLFSQDHALCSPPQSEPDCPNVPFVAKHHSGLVVCSLLSNFLALLSSCDQQQSNSWSLHEIQFLLQRQSDATEMPAAGLICAQCTVAQARHDLQRQKVSSRCWWSSCPSCPAVRWWRSGNGLGVVGCDFLQCPVHRASSSVTLVQSDALVCCSYLRRDCDKTKQSA